MTKFKSNWKRAAARNWDPCVCHAARKLSVEGTLVGNAGVFHLAFEETLEVPDTGCLEVENGMQYSPD